MPCAGGFAGLKLRSGTADQLFSLATSRALAIRSIVILDCESPVSVRACDLSLESLFTEADPGLCLDCDWLPLSLWNCVFVISSSGCTHGIRPRGSSSERCSLGRGGEGFLANLTLSGLDLLSGCQQSSGVRAGEGLCVLGLVLAPVWVFLPDAAISERAFRRAVCDTRSTSPPLMCKSLSDATKKK